ncbi:thiol-disulfide oxidoreductase DCC family protein [Neogemmobacter tilapiae]|uniref:Thiol-disulfide oxidoreductase n=1 Tax=Neogemmobacter tilapiae TaxID=875041 RepID=A0A918TUR0_9RHOB|nr:DCC1-like thiol-disulfide oxidoreductase family protein [Gemmobacter tilapiae]GHC64391.1 thiol-disulfide oxidoreductase [Gemmobacter tilapiae]
MGDLIVFDGLCIFCSGFARFMARHDRAGRFRFVTAQSDLGQRLYREHGLDPVAMVTNIVIVDGVAHQKMAAFAAAMACLPAPWRWARVVGYAPKGPANWVYDRIARNRYVFGRRDCPLPSSALKARLIE